MRTIIKTTAATKPANGLLVLIQITFISVLIFVSNPLIAQTASVPNEDEPDTAIAEDTEAEVLTKIPQKEKEAREREVEMNEDPEAQPRRSHKTILGFGVPGQNLIFMEVRVCMVLTISTRTTN